MKKTESNVVWVSVGITKNIGNYESVRVDAGASKEFEDIGKQESWQELWDLVDAQIASKLMEIEENFGSR